jgi:hypothetical protein
LRHETAEKTQHNTSMVFFMYSDERILQRNIGNNAAFVLLCNNFCKDASGLFSRFIHVKG